MNFFASKIFAMKLCLLLLFARSIAAQSATTRQGRGVVESFNEGIKMAGQMFGVNTAADVANLVAKAFSGATSTAEHRQPNLMEIFQQLRRPSQREMQQTASDSQEAQETQAEETPTAPTHSTTKEEAAVNFDTPYFVTNVLRMIGFDASKLGALAINALIMIAQAIGNTLMAATKSTRFSDIGSDGHYELTANQQYSSADDQRPRQLRSGNGSTKHPNRQNIDDNNNDKPLDWYLQRHGDAGIKRLLAHAFDVNLSDRLVEMIEKVETTTKGEGQGACLKMLMCKSSPFIWGMQRSLQARYGNDTIEAPADKQQRAHLKAQQLFSDFPSVAEYRQHGHECERRFAQQCDVKQLIKA